MRRSPSRSRTCACKLEAARALTYRATLLSEIPGVRCSKEASMAKVFATEAANAIAARAVQIFGGLRVFQASIRWSGTIEMPA